MLSRSDENDINWENWKCSTHAFLLRVSNLSQRAPPCAIRGYSDRVYPPNCGEFPFWHTQLEMSVIVKLPLVPVSRGRKRAQSDRAFDTLNWKWVLLKATVGSRLPGKEEGSVWSFDTSQAVWWGSERTVEPHTLSLILCHFLSAWYIPQLLSVKAGFLKAVFTWFTISPSLNGTLCPVCDKSLRVIHLSNSKLYPFTLHYRECSSLSSSNIISALVYFDMACTITKKKQNSSFVVLPLCYIVHSTTLCFSRSFFGSTWTKALLSDRGTGLKAEL